MDPLSEKEIEDRLAELEGWEYDENALETTFEFQNFREAFTLMTRIAFECEAQGHHPDWTNVYNRLHIRLSTHDAGGVTAKDFRLAKTIEALVGTDE
ncbi:4a-hydroxytetrahydrobiopterin dehydratase [Robiginitalea marina]|uniref:Putative pterin-4-alpha-carbinolamine dehydratase n=1 Tax=Robiginitalea marina TaxID=2954105 RepID=A0ABT1AUQ2_9FLAO|nr:4a-hydroxytetrahydrobiopterin dehydratase [Robiginitalea marina]MCO5723783.1 4a-hydroxytetrahydrobiopterin dehydratase [Robiginitalea marina]